MWVDTEYILARVRIGDTHFNLLIYAHGTPCAPSLFMTFVLFAGFEDILAQDKSIYISRNQSIIRMYTTRVVAALMHALRNPHRWQ